MSIKLGDALVYIGAKKDGLKGDLDDAKKDTNSWVNSVSAGIGIALGDAILRAVGKGIQAVGNLGKSVVDFSYDSQKAILDFQSELGATAEEAAILGKVAQNVWKNNFGADIGDAANAVGLVRQQLKMLNTEGIQLASQSALAIRDAYGTDVVKSISAAKTLMQDFSMTNQQAWDFIAAGYQRGLNRSGDFLESITEYGPQFGSASASAGQFFSAMETGMQGGMLGTDRALDMFKEFRVRLLDGSETTSAGLAQIGLSMDDVTQSINSGSLTWTDAFTMVQDGIRGADSQATQMQAGVALLGTQFEDMGTQAALAVDLTQTSLEDLNGAAEQVNIRYNNLGDIFSGLGRRMVAALSPATDALLGMANDAAPEIESSFARLEANASTFAVGLAGIFKALAGVAKSFFRGFRKDSDEELGGTAQEAGAWGRNIVVQLARGMASAMTAVVIVLNNIGKVIADWLSPGSPPKLLPDIDKWGTAAMQEFIDGMGRATVGGLQAMGGRIMETLSGVKDAGLVGLFSAISGTIKGLMQSTAVEDDAGLVGRIIGSRAVIGQAIQDIQQYGHVTGSTLATIQQAMVSLPPAANDYVRAMLELYQASQKVTRAQEELNRVTQEYDDKIGPLADELRDLRNQDADIADEKRIAALRQAIARGALNEEQKAQALREIRARELALQIRGLEEEKETAVDAAQEKLDAAEAEKKAAEEAVALQQALIDAQLESNSLIQQQVSLLDRLADTMAGVGAALADALSGAGDGLGMGEFDPLAGLGDIGLGDDPLGLEAALGEIDVQSIVDEITAAFEPLETEMGNLSTTFSNLGDAWDDFLLRFGLVDEEGQSTLDWLGTLGDVLLIVGGAVLGIKLSGLVVGLLGLVGAAGAASGFMGTFGAIITALGGPVVWLMALIGALAAAWHTDFMGMRTTLTYLGELFMIILERLWQRVVKWDQEVGDKFHEWREGVRENFKLVGDYFAVLGAEIWLKANEMKTTFLQLQQKVKDEFAQIGLRFEEAKTAVSNMRDKFIEKIQQIAGEFGAVKDKVSAWWDMLKGLWEWIKSHTFDISLPDFPGIGGGDTPDGTRATGGPVNFGGAYLVGERGPELFMPQSAGSIIPNGGVGAPTPAAPVIVQFLGNILLGDQATAEYFVSYLEGLSEADAMAGISQEFA